MLIDVLIVLFCISAIYRGRRSGFVHQFFSAAGFFGGLFIGSLIEPHIVNFAHSPQSRTLLTITTTLSFALIGLTIGEYLGYRLKRHVYVKPINRVDNFLGSILSIISLLLGIWLVASVLTNWPSTSIHTALRNSRIVNGLNRILPPAPNVIAGIGRIIDPNGFPDVFAGNEPVLQAPINLPSLGIMANAVNQDEASVLRIRGQGCGGIVSGSGFIFKPGLVATNAHVVAGITHPVAQDTRGNHNASVVLFDPRVDLAVLRVNNLSNKSLKINQTSANHGTPAAALGYPGGGDFSARPAAVIEQFEAIGRDIYGRGRTVRNVYEIQANIIPGNSGGPLIDQAGSVIGMIFAESTTYNHVGYALTGSQINGELNDVSPNSGAVSTGTCTE
ncbi:MAG TPA: MarP family serine protease [Candidatus Saccharimonadales bacterium]|nr:MarP family serine protease [Candidatus Saccharimonadales bacterium]